MDFVIPKNNEKDLLAKAKELGLELIFLYEAKNKNELFEGGAQEHRPASGVLIRAEKLADLRRVDKFPLETLIVVASTNTEVIQAACSKRNINYVTHLATSISRDHTHYRRGNVNQVIAKLCYENKICYVIDFSHILACEGNSRAILIGRIMQNIKIFKKYKVLIKVASFARDEYGLRNPRDLEAFGRVLGI